ncbi:MAG: hypothetical protein LQ350_005915 [Teloschistes chrysophthalmus]|nr:MAG: hypothetical protein LQ350_005915 [Niorma chrysophthalma]
MIVIHPAPVPTHFHTAKAAVIETVTAVDERAMDHLSQEVQELFEQQLKIDSLLALSKKLQAEFKEGLQASPQCMLPSHNYTLPDGKEHGTYLGLEVGGSTLRVALVDLDGRTSSRQPLRIRRIVTSPIDSRVRDLRGLAFFDWIAGKIGEMLVADREAHDYMQLKEPLPMGVAWSFPIDQTSIRSGNIIGMGKGFYCSTYKGHDLGELITQACQRLNLNIRLDAIVNDSSAAVLSRAYIDPSTRLAVILGTGLNAAIRLPISSLHESKFGLREFPSTVVSHVLVNTELSMFGKRTFPSTRWDGHLNAHHMMPDYQPMEYLLSGGYMGEIVRLIVIEAIETAGLFDGRIPPALSAPYTLDTYTLAAIEADTYPSLSPSCELFQENYHLPLPPTPTEMHFIRQVILAVSRRSQGYFTAAIYALSSLLHEADDQGNNLYNNGLDHISIGCDGSVINKYPGYMENCQKLLDQLSRVDPEKRKRVVLESAGESAVLGAGVAVAMANASGSP